MIDDFCAEARRLADAGMLEEALQSVVSFVRVLNEDPAVAGQIYESRDVDAVCLDLGRKHFLLPEPESAADLPQDAQVYVSTELYAAGGHTRVLHDFLSVQPGRLHVILVTDIFNRTDPDETAAQFAGLPVLFQWAPRGGLVEKTRWLAKRLCAVAGRRIFLFHHHEDAVAVVASAAVRPPRLHFYHHADHHLTLGMHLDCEAHVDLTAFSFFHCRDHIGLPQVVYLPLTTNDFPPRPLTHFSRGSESDSFLTCAAGNEGKFCSPYDFRYFSMIADRLEAAAGRHLHIGPLGQERLEEITATLRHRNLAEDRFQHLPQVPSLSGALGELGVSLYLGSWPIGGARGLLEALASGTPVFGHANYEHEYLGCHSLLPPGAPLWHRPQEFTVRLSSITAKQLQQWSAENRRHWESFHRGALLREALAGDCLPERMPPPLPPYEPDRLRSWLARKVLDGAPAPGRALAAAERKIQLLEQRLEKSRASLCQVRERLAQVRSERDEAKRSLGTKLRGWLRGN